jgi:hypothetical protein
MLNYTDLPIAAEHTCSDRSSNARSWNIPKTQQTPQPDNCKAHQGAIQTTIQPTGHIFRILLT